MPRKPVIRSGQHYYHLSARSDDKDHFHLPTEEMWEILVRRMALLQIEFSLKIAAFIVLENQFRAIVLSPNENIDKISYFLMKDSTRTIQKRTGRINKIYGTKCKACVIKGQKEIPFILKYLWLLPVERHLSISPIDYEFSSLYYQFRPEMKLKLQIEHPLDILKSLTWINSGYTPKESDSIKCGLTRTEFSFKKDGPYGPIIPRALL